MKHRITLSLVLTLCMLLPLSGFPPAAQGQQPRIFRIDSGVITPSTGQVLRVTVAGASGNDTIKVRLRWMQYAATGCSGAPPVCRHMVASQGATPLETLGSDDALSFDVQGAGSGIRVVVESNRRDARAVFQIINSATGEVVAIWHPFGDF
jgi:hypothetical protein